MLNKIKSYALMLVKNPLFYIVTISFIVDLVSKWCVVLNINEFGHVDIIPNFLYVTLEFNRGGMFSFGANSEAARIILVIIRFLLAVGLPILYVKYGTKLKMRYKVCLALIYAGCLGNLIDGLFYYDNIVGFTGVVDWIRFTFFNATFNLADSYVTVAVFLILIFAIIEEIMTLKERNRNGEFSLPPEEYEKRMKEKDHEDSNK